MCTLVIYRRPEHAWPLLLAANRDEMRDRPWQAPARHWDDRPEVIAGLDELGGGSWFGLNDYGVVATVTNREGTLGPAANKRSRGELVLEALDHAEAGEAARALADLDPRAYREFNLFVGDPVSAYWLSHRGGGADAIDVLEIPPGLHMLTAGNLDDTRIPRIRQYLPRFQNAAFPDPDGEDWAAWQRLLACREYRPEDGAIGAMNIDLPSGFGTICSHLLALPRYPGYETRPYFLFADGPPDQAPFKKISVTRTT